MKSPHRHLRDRTRRGAALIIVLAFVVLLAGLVVAFFSNSLLYRQISNSSASQAKVDLFAQGAVDTLVGDLKEEIAAGSTTYIYTDRNSTPRGAVVGQDYQPLNANAAVPALALKGSQTGVTSFAPNLVKRSAYQQNFYPVGPDPGASSYTGGKLYSVVLPSNGAAPVPTTPTYTPSNRAANLSTTKPSQNGRFLSPARWNKALLLPKYTATSATDFTPVDPIDVPSQSATTNVFIAPDWILAARDGSNPGTLTAPASFSGTGAVNDPSVSNNGYVVGRYAYAVYDEGGLLDANVAGFPASGTPPYTSANSDLNAISRKSALAFADLTQLPGISALSSTRQQAVVNNLVGWRNYATVQPGGTLSGGYTYNTSQLTNYSNSILGNLTGFLRTSNGVDPVTTGGQTDRMFASRQELMRLLLNGIAQDSTERGYLQNALQYVGTFSRELNQPSFVPLVHSNVPSPASTPNPPRVLSVGQGGTPAVGLDREINPNYQTVRVSKAFTRNDKVTPAVVGEPLVNKRFPLQRLAWLTYKGPSAGRLQTDPDIAALIAAGIPYSYLQQGTPDNIKAYFGLEWVGGLWKYDIHNNFFNGAASAGRGPIMRIGRNPVVDPVAAPTVYIQDLATPRTNGSEPDFFELLKSAITVGSLGKSLSSGNGSMTSPAKVDADASGDPNEQPYNYNYSAENSTDRQIIQIGANIINQFRADNFPVQIVFDNRIGNPLGSLTNTAMTISGVTNLPYIYDIMNGVLQVKPPAPLPRSGRTNTVAYSGDPGTGTDGDGGYLAADPTSSDPAKKAGDTISDPGVGVIMQMPVIWNPHDPSSPIGATGLSPTQFLVVADSTTPDKVDTSSGYSKFFAYASSDPGLGDNNPQHASSVSYKAVSGPMWYRSASGAGTEPGVAHAINAGNSAIRLTVNSGTTALFPEPTILMRAATITDSNGNSVSVTTDPTSHLLGTDTPVSGLASNGGLPNYIANATGLDDVPFPSTTRYLGFYMAAFPWAWDTGAPNAPASAAQSDAQLVRMTGADRGNANTCYMTYRMQYLDASGTPVTYDMKYGKVADGKLVVAQRGSDQNGKGSLHPDYTGKGVLLEQRGYWATVTDPRTSRFGLHWNGTIDGQGTNDPQLSDGLFKSVLTAGWTDPANGVLKSNRPDAQSGYYFMSGWNRAGGTGDQRRAGMPSATSGWMAWTSSNGDSYPGLTPGLLSQNNADIPYAPARYYTSIAADGQGHGTHTPNYFADPDGIVRRGMAAFVPTGLTSSPTEIPSDNRLPSGDTTVGLPTVRAFGSLTYPPAPVSPTIKLYSASTSQSQAQSRPYFLHRPFRSVAELGCVFTDTPWRNLDFFTSESGNTALLDVFCINESDNTTGLVAGKVNLNTRQAPVVQAIIGGAYLDPATVTGNNPAGQPMDSDTASKVGAALTTYLANNGPLQNVAELVGRWKSNVVITHPTGTETTQPALAAPFYDGKLSYGGFSGGDWDLSNHLPKVNTPPSDVYSAYKSSGSFASSINHNGTQETVAYIQRFREAPVRALAASGQTRVWNLMIDLVAQTGRYPINAATLANFTVEGEQRYWVHLAIDRYSGQVIDKQIEIVKE